MKTTRIIITFCLAFVMNAALSQTVSGLIEYEFRMDMHRNIPPEREGLKAMIPQFRVLQYQLLFDEQQSIYRVVEDEETAFNMERGGMRIAMQMPRTETFTDRFEKEIVVQQDFMGTTYLVSEPLEIGPWRIGDEILEIEGYRCMMAWYDDTVFNHAVTAWFTTELPPFLGPDRYASLPGTVLALDINDGERVWVARKIKATEHNQDAIKRPSRGQRISREEYLQLVREQRERMERQGIPFRF